MNVRICFHMLDLSERAFYDFNSFSLKQGSNYAPWLDRFSRNRISSSGNEKRHNFAFFDTRDLLCGKHGRHYRNGRHSRGPLSVARYEKTKSNR